MIILSANKGRVCRFNLQDEQRPGTITFGFVPAVSVDSAGNTLRSPSNFSYESLHVIFDAVGLAFSPSYQLSDTLSDDILMMTFGESISPVTLRGTVLTAVCQDSIGAGVGDPNAGVVRLVNWWEERNLTKQRVPAQITIDSNASFGVYVADMKLSVEDTENRLWKFSLSLLRVPLSRGASKLNTSSVPKPQINPTPAANSSDVLVIPPSAIRRSASNTLVNSESLQRFGTVTPANPAGFNSPNTPLVGPLSGL